MTRYHQIRLGRAAREMTHGVQHFVTGPGGGTWWENIALFNCEPAANGYRDTIIKERPELTAVYRVVELT